MWQHRLDDFEVVVSQCLAYGVAADGFVHELLVFTVGIRYNPVVKRTEPKWGWCTGTTQRDGMGREEGRGFGMGNTCIPVVDSF